MTNSVLSFYMGPGSPLRRKAIADVGRDLQKDLRRLGNLKSQIWGIFDAATETVGEALQHNLLSSRGNGTDGRPRVSVLECNRSGIVLVYEKPSA